MAPSPETVAFGQTSLSIFEKWSHVASCRFVFERLGELVMAGKRSPWPVVGFLVFLVCCGGCSSQQSRVDFGHSRRPNIILISIDTLNRSALAAFDPSAPSHPHLDAWSKNAFLFQRAHTAAPWTLPAQASLLTGLYPKHHGATAPKVRIFAHAPRLAEVLSRAGYATAAFTGSGFVDGRYGFDKGFDYYDDAGPAQGETKALALPRAGKYDPSGNSVLFDRAIAYLTQRQDTKAPFFLFLQTYLVHDYFQVHAYAFQSLGPSKTEQSHQYLECLTGKAQCSVDDWDRLRSLYEVEVQHVDMGIEQLFDTLHTTGEYDSTIFIFVSDHGEGFDPERQRIHHGGRLHSDLIRVPMVISGPGIPTGSTDEPVSLIDVMPTLIDLLELPKVEELDGISLRPLLEGHSLESDRTLLASEFYYLWSDGQRRSTAHFRNEPISLAAITPQYWYIETPDGQELYDVHTDPMQRTNMVRRDDLLTQIDMRLRSIDRRRVTFEEGDKGVDFSPELKQHLEALGYIE